MGEEERPKIATRLVAEDVTQRLCSFARIAHPTVNGSYRISCGGPDRYPPENLFCIFHADKYGCPYLSQTHLEHVHRIRAEVVRRQHAEEQILVPA